MHHEIAAGEQKTNPIPTLVSQSRTGGLRVYAFSSLSSPTSQCIRLILVFSFIIWIAPFWRFSVAQAQELPANGNASAVRPTFVQRPIEGPHTPPLVELSMVDRGNVGFGAPSGPAIHFANLHPVDTPNPPDVKPPLIVQGAEYASLAALASAPPSSLLKSTRINSAERTHESARANADKALVYRLGTLNLVINRLPGRFSLSSPANSSVR